MLMVLDKSIHEESLAQPLQVIIKQLKLVVTFLFGYNGILMLESKMITFISQNPELLKTVWSKEQFDRVLNLKK